jgi:hypothetical protein
VKVGPLPDRGGGPATLSASAPCAEGCRLAQISILRPTSDEDGVFIDAAITGLYAGRPGAYSRVPLGATAEWGEATPETPVSHVVIDNPQYSVGKISLSSAAGGGIQLTAFHMGAPEVLQHLDVPVAVPALVADGVAPVLDQRGFLPSVNIDGNLAPFRPVGQVAFVPGSLGPALLVDADLAAAVATPTLGDSTTAIWLAADNPARERALVASLRQHGVAVVSRDTAARHRAVLAAAAPAWAMQLAIVTALLAVLIAALVILISATMSRRSRAADAAALGLVGVDLAWLRRATLIEHLVAVVAGVVVGSAIGVVGAQMALPGTPIFLVDFQAPAIVRDAAWGAISFAAALAMAALVVTSVGTSLALVRRVATQRPGRPVEAEQ